MASIYIALPLLIKKTLSIAWAEAPMQWAATQVLSLRAWKCHLNEDCGPRCSSMRRKSCAQQFCNLQAQSSVCWVCGGCSENQHLTRWTLRTKHTDKDVMTSLKKNRLAFLYQDRSGGICMSSLPNPMVEMRHQLLLCQAKNGKG